MTKNAQQSAKAHREDEWMQVSTTQTIVFAPRQQVMIAEFTFGHKLPEISRVVLTLLHFR